MIKSTEFISTKLFYKKAVLWEKNPKSHFNALAYLENGLILVPV